jgi:hypothetical protein
MNAACASLDRFRFRDRATAAYDRPSSRRRSASSSPLPRREPRGSLRSCPFSRPSSRDRESRPLGRTHRSRPTGVYVHALVIRFERAETARGVVRLHRTTGHGPLLHALSTALGNGRMAVLTGLTQLQTTGSSAPWPSPLLTREQCRDHLNRLVAPPWRQRGEHRVTLPCGRFLPESTWYCLRAG